MIFLGERQLWYAVEEFAAHYHTERNHQGMGNKLLVASTSARDAEGEVRCSQRLGGLLRYYHRAA